MEKEQDFQLWSSIQQGDTDAFKQLHDSYYNILFSRILQHIPDRQDAEDILQDTFYTLWQDREKIDIKSSLFSYTYSIMRFKVLRHMQGKQKTREQNHAWISLFQEEEDSMDVDDSYTDAKWAFLEKNIHQLPMQLKKVYAMHIEKGESLSDVADELDLSKHTVKNYVRDIKKRFRLAAHIQQIKK